MTMSISDWGLLLLLSLLWGGAFFFVGVAVPEVPPLTIVLCRVGLAAIALFVYLKIKKVRIPVDRNVLIAFAGMGILNNLIPFSLLFWAQTSIPSGLASILNATTPIFSITVAHFMLADERMTANRLAGVVLGFIGVAVLMGPDTFAGADLSTLAMIACLVAALSYGIATVFARRFKRMEIPSTVGAFGQLAASTIIMTPFVLVIDRPWTLSMPGPSALAAVIALALASTALAYMIYFRLLETAGAVNAALVTLLVPVSAILLGTAFLGEILLPRHFAGMVFIGLGLIAVDGRLFKLLRR